MQSRTKLASKNIFATLIVNILIFPLQFINRYYMVHFLGVTYLGITSLYTNILSILSLADLGIGTAIVFLMYKPLANNDSRKISILMRYYRLVYRIIALVILLFGLMVIPFLKFFLHSSINYPNVYFLFLIYLLGTVSTYLFSYNQSLLFADQKNRIYSWYNLAVCYVMMIAQIVTVIKWRNPLLYAAFYVFTGFVTNLFVAVYVHRNYHVNYHKSNDKLSVEEHRELRSNVIGNMFLRVSGVVVTGTDSVMLSAFTSVVQVGLYANYLTITNVIQQLMIKVIGAVTGSIGSFAVTNDKSHSERLFFNLQFLNFIFLNFATLGIVFASKDVITIWLGPKYVLSPINTALIACSFYFMNYRVLGWNFVAVFGLAKYMKLFSVNEMVVNLVATVIFLKQFHMGISGVVLGTIISTLLTVGWQDAYVIFHHGFHTTLVGYFKQYLCYFFTFLFELVLISLINYFCPFSIRNNWLACLLHIAEVVLTGSIIPLVFFAKTEECHYLLSVVRRVLKL